MLPVRADNPTSKTGISEGSSKTSRSTRSHHARKQDHKEGRRGRCSVCQGDHFVMFCDQYKGKTASERKRHVTEINMCVNCLERHKTNEYTSKNCSACGDCHHSSLHDAFHQTAIVKTTYVARRPNSVPVAVLLATACVRVFDRHGSWHPVRALVDQGSKSSIVSERLAQRLKLPRSSTSVAVYGVGGMKNGVSRG